MKEINVEESSQKITYYRDFFKNTFKKRHLKGYFKTTENMGLKACLFSCEDISNIVEKLITHFRLQV